MSVLPLSAKPLAVSSEQHSLTQLTLTHFDQYINAHLCLVDDREQWLQK